jgi:hypothetical protein
MPASLWCPCTGLSISNMSMRMALPVSHGAGRLAFYIANTTNARVLFAQVERYTVLRSVPSILASAVGWCHAGTHCAKSKTRLHMKATVASRRSG